MSKISRDVPKAIASFGEKQFKETGASLVEVLRVKESTLRKYFRQLRGILYVVAVVSRDRVRAYFFNAAGAMIIGENLEAEQYNDIRKSARIVAKFEKPRPLTPEELRIEATQDLRDALGKAIRRVSRALTLKEPLFPDIFVTRQEGEKEHQGFGIHITDDYEILFEESILAKSWSEGLFLRVGFLLHLDHSRWKSEFAAVVGNGIALSLLKDQARTAWHSEWKKRSKNGIWEPVVNHFSNHALTYNHKGYHWIALLLKDLPLESTFDDWKKAMRVTHDALSLPMGTEEYHIISGFCKSLKNPRQLAKRRHLLDAIHMAPRALCDPTPLRIYLSVAHEATKNQDAWAKVRYTSGAVAKTLQIVESDDSQIRSMEYWLNLEDMFPITGGPISQGRSVVARSLARLGLLKHPQGTFEAILELKERPSLDSKDIAILERLILGDAKIFSNSLVGSPQSIRNLVEKGVVALIPNFNHLGVTADYLIHGPMDHVRRLAHSVPEGMIFNTSPESYGVLSAPTNWSHALIEDANEAGVGLWPILSVESGRQILREEVLFPVSERTYQWSESVT